MWDDTEDSAEWIDDTLLAEAACVTMVESDDLEAVSRGFGGLAGQARELTLDEVYDEAYREDDEAPDMTMAIRRVGAWLLVVEINGFQGIRPEVLKRVSTAGRAVSAYWNVNTVTHFSYAAAGEIRTEFEPVSPEDRFGTDPDGLEELRAGLPWEDEDAVPLMLTLTGRITGAPLQPEWLEERFLVMPVQPVADEVVPGLDPDLKRLTYEEGTLAWALRHADEPTLRRATQVAVDYLIEATGIGRFPEVTAFAPDDLRPCDALDELAARLDRDSDRHRDDRSLGAQFVAVRALRHAANPDPLAAAFEAIEEAFLSLRVGRRDARELRAAVSAALGAPGPPSGSLGLTAGTGPRPTDRYEWITRHWLRPRGALTVVRGASVPEVTQALGGELSQAREGIPVMSDEPLAFVRQAGDWVVAIYPDGGPGKLRLESRWRRLPAAASAVYLGWQGNSVPVLCYAIDSKLCSDFNPYNPGDREGSDPARLEPFLTGLDLPVKAASIAATLPTLLVIAERLSGLALTPAWLDQPHLVVPGRPYVMW